MQDHKILGLIFDFDGLMVETEMPAYDSWRDIYREYGCELPFSLWSSVLGTAHAEFDPCVYLAEQTGLELDAVELRARRWQRKLELVAGQPLLPGVQEYITSAKQMGLLLGVASSSTRKWVVDHLARLDVLHQFDTITTCEDVKLTKPDPEIFQLATARLGLQAKQVIVLEDSPNGLLAAKRAGMFCVAIPNALTMHLSLNHADLRLVSLSDLSLKDLLAIVEQSRNATATPLARDTTKDSPESH